MSYLNHQRYGFLTVRHKGKVITSAFNSQSFEKGFRSIINGPYNLGYVQSGYEHRPDLISELFYDTPTFDWLIMMANNIADPFQGLNVGDRIKIPVL